MGTPSKALGRVCPAPQLHHLKSTTFTSINTIFLTSSPAPRTPSCNPALPNACRSAAAQTASSRTRLICPCRPSITAYSSAYRRPATAVEALLASVTCNFEITNVWLHGRENVEGSVTPTHFMRSIHACTDGRKPVHHTGHIDELTTVCAAPASGLD
jgi:hypothetical protein